MYSSPSQNKKHIKGNIIISGFVTDVLGKRMLLNTFNNFVISISVRKTAINNNPVRLPVIISANTFNKRIGILKLFFSRKNANINKTLIKALITCASVAYNSVVKGKDTRKLPDTKLESRSGV